MSVCGCFVVVVVVVVLLGGGRGRGVVTGMCLCVSQTCAQETHSPSHVTWLYYGGARGVIIGSTTVVCV